jgi:hypothetical protein
MGPGRRADDDNRRLESLLRPLGPLAIVGSILVALSLGTVFPLS